MIKEFRPKLLPVVRDLALTANQRFLSRTLSGTWLSTFKGRGMEFSDYRQYQTGDDASMIDWRASLRARKILVKELTEEKNLNVFIVLDVCNSMLYGSGELLKAEVACQLVSSIAYAALKAGDAVGLVTINDQIQNYLQPAIGVHQHGLILDTISKPENWGGKLDFGKSMAQLMGAVKGQGLVIFVSDFIGLEDDWYRFLEVANERFEMVGLVVRDPRDRRLPKNAGEYVLEDPFEDKKIIIDCAKYAVPYAKHVKEEEELIQRYFRMVKGDTLVIETGQDYVKPLMSFFHRRAAQGFH